MKPPRWNLHICHPWSGPCAMRSVRLNIYIPHRFIIIALTPEGKVVEDTYGPARWISVDKI